MGMHGGVHNIECLCHGIVPVSRAKPICTRLQCRASQAVSLYCSVSDCDMLCRIERLGHSIVA